MSEERKPKNYYTLNLTEGRIFIIFIAILIVIVLVVFSIALFNSSKKNSVTNLSVQDSQISNNELADHYTYYDRLGNNTLTNNSLANSSNSSISSEANNIKTDNLNNENNEIKLNDNSAKPDDSEVLYSSKFINNNKSIDESKIKSLVTKSDKKSNIKSNSSSTERKIRYIIQIGSYTNKKLALEVSTYYEKIGYPTFIKEIESNGKKYYRLRIGPYKEKEKASNYLVKLKSTKYGKDSYISIVYL
jgi:hypothetical protein